MNMRQRRLVNDYQKVLLEFDRHKYIQVKPVGQAPYEQYDVTYHVSSLYWDNARNQPVEKKGGHRVEIKLPLEYPRSRPVCKILTPVFHPNFGQETICIGDHWAASSNLVDTIIKIGEMLQFRDFNVKSPMNAKAARWAQDNKQYLPVGRINLYQPEEVIDIGSSHPADDDDLEITFGAKPKQADDDFDIVLR